MTTIHDLASIEVRSAVGVDDHKPFVHVRVVSTDASVIGDVDPSTAIDLGLRFLEAATAAEFDAALFALMLRRLGNDPAAHLKAASILQDLREQREAGGG